MIFVPDVEKIMEAFAARLRTIPPFGPFDTMGDVTRVWQPWDQISKLNQPAIVITEPKESETSRRGQQPALKLDVRLVCYVQVDPADQEFEPNTRVNLMIQAIRTALLPTTGQDKVLNAQTLDGLVNNVFIDGEVLKDSGIIDNQGSALIPVTVLIT